MRRVMTQAPNQTIQDVAARLPASVRHYTEFQRAFEHYRTELFEGGVADCIIVMSRKNRTHGYLAPDRWNDGNGLTLHELALNPTDFAERTTEEVLSTLVHEMVHAWQQSYGESVPRGNYHNKEWAERMAVIGLIPSNTGDPGGKRTGQSMTHYIDLGGPFALSTARLLDGGWTIPYIDLPAEDAKQKARRPKYVCPECGASVWGKGGLRIECVDCQAGFEEEVPDEDEGGDWQH